MSHSAGIELMPKLRPIVSEATAESITDSTTQLHPQAWNASGHLPPFDKGLDIRARRFVALLSCYVISAAIIILGVVWYVFAGKQAEENNAGSITSPVVKLSLWYPTVLTGAMSDSAREFVILFFQSMVTGATESLGNINATSLRWALYHEGCLQRNSNPRIFSTSTRTLPNSWYASAIWTFLLVLAHSCASESILSPASNRYFGFNSMAILLLGICMLLLCLLAHACLLPRYQNQIVSWNSDPLNTALAILHLNGPSHLPAVEKGPSRKPNPRQQSLKTTYPRAIVAVAALWLLAPLLFVFAGVIMYMNNRNWRYVSSPTDSFYSGFLLITIRTPGGGSRWAALPFLNILFLAVLQIPHTLALHAVEHLFNMLRDEQVWREASDLNTEGGAIVGGDSRSTVFPWQVALMVGIKTVTHWLYGLSIEVDPNHQIAFHPPPLFILGGVTLLLAGFLTFIILRQPQGPQPATYGDIKMLGELIDEWGNGAGDRLYWGDKGGVDADPGVKCAGTSPELSSVANIIMDGPLYRGVGTEREQPKARARHSFRPKLRRLLS